MTPQLSAVVPKHVEMVGAPWRSLHEVVPTRNAVLAPVLVAEIDQERDECTPSFKELSDDGNVENWFREDAGYGRATDMLISIAAVPSTAAMRLRSAVKRECHSFPTGTR